MKVTRGIAMLGSLQEEGLSREGFRSMAERELFTRALGRVKNRFLLTNILAKRIAQLRKGSEPLVQIENASHETIALMEIIEGKLQWEFGGPAEVEGKRKRGVEGREIGSGEGE